MVLILLLSIVSGSVSGSVPVPVSDEAGSDQSWEIRDQILKLILDKLTAVGCRRLEGNRSTYYYHITRPDSSLDSSPDTCPMSVDPESIINHLIRRPTYRT